MPLTELHIHQFRNLTTASLQPSAAFNLLYGENGAGKTSILEAIYLLSHNKSFRSSKIEHLIQNNHTACAVRAVLADQQHIAIQRHKDKPVVAKLNSNKAPSIHAITQRVPSILITTKSYRYFTDGSKYRRSFLNWGLYHSQRDFLSLWRDNQKALAQRNAALKQSRHSAALEIWTNKYINGAEQIHAAYQDYIEQLQPIFTQLVEDFLPDMQTHLRLDYQCGWNTDISLKQALDECHYADQQAGHTTRGIHRADMQMYYQNIPVHQFLSQGQQKLASYALVLAQGKLLHQTQQLSPIYLIDDLPAELDQQKQRLVLDSIANINSQCFITSIEPLHLNNYPHEKFHVTSGCVSRETQKTPS